MTPKEVANLLQVEEKTLAQWRSNGLVNLPFVKLGGAVRYEEAAVGAFVESQRRNHTGAR
jgi:excisionase family DNA binding protein